MYFSYHKRKPLVTEREEKGAMQSRHPKIQAGTLALGS
jgi:hypothetical protein